MIAVHGMPGTALASIGEPCEYSPAQHRLAITVCWGLQRGLFVLTVEPEGTGDP